MKRAIRFGSYFLSVLAVTAAYTFLAAVVSQAVTSLTVPALWMGVGASVVVVAGLTSVIAFNLSQGDDDNA